jgi:hypothetical protein
LIKTLAAPCPRLAADAMHYADGVPTMTATPERPPAPTALEQPAPDVRAPGDTRFLEAIFDNLSFWTLICAVIAMLYLVWATIEVYSRYVGHVPSLTP